MTSDGKQALSWAVDNTVCLWDLRSGECFHVLEGRIDSFTSIALAAEGSRALTGAADGTVRLWDLQSGECLRIFEGHSTTVTSVALTADGGRALPGATDYDVRLWDTETGKCLRVLKGHSGIVSSVALAADGRRAISGAVDKTVRLWDVESGKCLRVLEGHSDSVSCVALAADGLRLFSAAVNGVLRSWRLDAVAEPAHTEAGAVVPPIDATDDIVAGDDQVLYTNAKVLLVGESGVRKTGLSKRLASNVWEPSDSTVGAWATQWKLPVSGSKGVEREIWLWDFGGQADQRLIHQLYLDDTALAVLVFDGQKEDLFETLGQWDRDLTRASRKEFAKLLVAGRVDSGGLRVSRSDVEKFAAERKFRGFLETSAKKNQGCEELKQAILAAINWDELPCRTTEVLFKRLKEEIIRLKDEGRVLIRFNELRETLQLRLSGEFKQFADEELRAVLTLLAGPGVVWELTFGSWVLLQPERINAYAQAVIRTLQADEFQRGCLMEDRVLKGDLAYESSMPRLSGDEERFVLLAMHQTLVERGLCLRQPTSKGNLLVFPSYNRRERPHLGDHPAVMSTYRFTGFLDEIYATLVVRLHHTVPFQQDSLWRRAADFKTVTGKLLGIQLIRYGPGMGEMEVYFDPAISMEEKIIFCKYVRARPAGRVRHRAEQPKQGTRVGGRSHLHGGPRGPDQPGVQCQRPRH
jgi:small GTP-binding protein